MASWKLLWFFFPGLLLSLFYSLPPFRFAYRPFLGEFLGGFAAIATVDLIFYGNSLHLKSLNGLFSNQ
jgi:hypothetical protein